MTAAVPYRVHSELLGFARFGIPTNQKVILEVKSEFGFSTSSLYHFTPRLIRLLEVNGEMEGNTTANQTLRIKRSHRSFYK